MLHPIRHGLAITTLVLTAFLALGAEKPTITFDAKAISGSVSPLLFGVNHCWVSNASGSADPKTGLTYPKVVDQIKDVGISMIRYPAGTLGNTFQWERAIGPREKRGMQVGGLVTMPIPYDSKFGPDEYGDLLDRTGSMGNLMINCATATSTDAANFVAYMTAPAGSAPVNGVDWAARRGANGHPAPYKIAYVEIGNEYEPTIQPLIDQNYWIRGKAASLKITDEAKKICRLYAFGGSTRFMKQPVVQLTDWREPTSISGGAPGQVVYARYPPVANGSETVFVGDKTWRRVTEFSTSTTNDTVYRLDARSGTITFGDGTHGAIPPKGARMTITYTSGPHEGFVDFYRAIKAVNPDVKVCSSIHHPEFIQLMGSQYPYDGIQQHPYLIGDPKKVKSQGLPDLFIQTAIATLKLGDQIDHTQQLVRQYAGAKTEKIDLLLSEYGQRGTFPNYAAHFGRSLGQAVLQALCLREWVSRHVAAANRAVLTDYTFKPAPPDLAAAQFSNADTAGDFAILAGPGPDTVVTPVALAMKLLRENTGTQLLTSSITASPKLRSSKGESLDALQSYATLDPNGNACLIVINVDPAHDITATVAPTNFPHARTASVATLASAGINDENSPSHPNKVAITRQTIDGVAETFDLKFPKHSVTAIRLSPQN